MKTAISQAATDATFSRLCDATTPMHGSVAVDPASGEVLGFAHYVVHPFTWSSLAGCYLEDLYVAPAARRRGAARRA